jgi:hypothetical protein
MILPTFLRLKMAISPGFGMWLKEYQQNLLIMWWFIRHKETLEDEKKGI